MEGSRSRGVEVWRSGGVEELRSALLTTDVVNVGRNVLPAMFSIEADIV